MSVDREVYRWQSYGKRNPSKLLAVKKSVTNMSSRKICDGGVGILESDNNNNNNNNNNNSNNNDNNNDNNDNNNNNNNNNDDDEDDQERMSYDLFTCQDILADKLTGDTTKTNTEKMLKIINTVV